MSEKITVTLQNRRFGGSICASTDEGIILSSDVGPPCSYEWREFRPTGTTPYRVVFVQQVDRFLTFAGVKQPVQMSRTTQENGSAQKWRIEPVEDPKAGPEDRNAYFKLRLDRDPKYLLRSADPSDKTGRVLAVDENNPGVPLDSEGFCYLWKVRLR